MWHKAVTVAQNITLAQVCILWVSSQHEMLLGYWLYKDENDGVCICELFPAGSPAAKEFSVQWHKDYMRHEHKIAQVETEYLTREGQKRLHEGDKWVVLCRWADRESMRDRAEESMRAQVKNRKYTSRPSATTPPLATDSGTSCVEGVTFVKGIKRFLCLECRWCLESCMWGRKTRSGLVLKGFKCQSAIYLACAAVPSKFGEGNLVGG